MFRVLGLSLVSRCSLGQDDQDKKALFPFKSVV